MSDRRSEFQNQNPNPCETWLKWESNHQKLSYFDKEAGEKGEKKLINIPFKFLVLKQMITVKGYNENVGGIYSNEVPNMNHVLNVKYFNGNTEIATGVWKDIKEKVESHEGKFTFSVYAMSSKGSLINLQFSGASASQWFNFTKKTKVRLGDEWVNLSGYKEGKKGAVTFHMPVFEFDGVIDKESDVFAQEHYDVLEAYFDKYLEAPLSSNEPMEGKSAGQMNDDEMDILANGKKEVNIEDADVSFDDLQKEPPF